MKNITSSFTVVMIAVSMAGCNSNTRSAAVDRPVEPTPAPTPVPVAPQQPSIPTPTPTQPWSSLEPSTPIIPATPIEPSQPIAPEPTTPIFRTINVTVLTQQPFTGITGNGDAWLIADSPVEFIQDLTGINIKVEYKYQPFIELYMVDHAGDEVCARYSLVTESFGAVKPVCIWSDVRNDIQLEDFKQAYYGYGVNEIGIWLGGVDGKRVGVE